MEIKYAKEKSLYRTIIFIRQFASDVIALIYVFTFELLHKFRCLDFKLFSQSDLIAEKIQRSRCSF